MIGLSEELSATGTRYVLFLVVGGEGVVSCSLFSKRERVSVEMKSVLFYPVWTLRPVPNFALLSCQTKFKNLIRLKHGSSTTFETI